MYIETADGPKLPWELEEDPDSDGPAQAKTCVAAPVIGVVQPQQSPDVVCDHEQLTKPKADLDPGLVALAERGNVVVLHQRIASGCDPDVFAFEYGLYPGSFRMYCNDRTPLTAAAAAGEASAVALLLDARANVNVVCRCSTSSGFYNSWTALDCATTGSTIPCERDPERRKQPRHASVQKLLLAAGALPSSELPEPPAMSTYGNRPEIGERPNPCLDHHGEPLRPPHLFDQAEEEARKRAPGAPKFSSSRGGSSGCPMSSIGLLGATSSQKESGGCGAGERVYSGGCGVNTVSRAP
ncbi:unnamed protein product [Polarella glacialis]|uniref:Uncharacterized protein n=1 Tax=Polarella glacialis TaxID=89957 RepID=A0A813JIV2_POLGL|nr:unnamed protein product [Polarella glacialis]